ncbi:MAG: type IV pilus modification PilV family protein [Candidatus Eiseniibacteriota bacterium]
MKRDDAGFTMVELMVAILLIAIGILPVAMVQSRSTRDVVATGQSTRALSIAQDRMEVTRTSGFSAAIVDSGVVTGGFTWKTNLTNMSTTLKRVDVTVSWTSRGAAQSLQISDLISDR